MDHIQIKSELIEQLIEISKEAGKAILEVYNTDFDYEIKKDLSPLTTADTLSNNIICKRLKALTPEIPILSEENSDIPFSVRSQWSQYWLVDPLDGTKEFINRNGEFTTNIALIYENRPIFGMVHVPASNEIFWGSNEIGAYHLSGDSLSNKKKISVSQDIKDNLRIAASRSHPSDELNNLLDRIENYKLLNVGSSLKLCLIASGTVDIYPRLGPTSEWDIAAGHAIVIYAGGYIVGIDGMPITYNSREDLINPEFIVSNNKVNADALLKMITDKENKST